MPRTRHRSRVRGRCGRLLPARLAMARRAGQRDQRQVQRARWTDLLGSARGGGAGRPGGGVSAQLTPFVGGGRARATPPPPPKGSLGGGGRLSPPPLGGG